MRAFTSHQRTKPPMRLPRWRRRPLPCRSLHPWTWRRRRRWQQVGRPPTRRARLCGAPRRGPRRRVVTAPARPPCRRGRPRRRWACPAAARQPAATARRWCRRRCWRRWGRGEPPAGRRSRCRRRTRWRTACSRRRRKRQRLGGGGAPRLASSSRLKEGSFERGCWARAAGAVGDAPGRFDSFLFCCMSTVFFWFVVSAVHRLGATVWLLLLLYVRVVFSCLVFSPVGVPGEWVWPCRMAFRVVVTVQDSRFVVHLFSLGRHSCLCIHVPTGLLFAPGDHHAVGWQPVVWVSGAATAALSVQRRAPWPLPAPHTGSAPRRAAAQVSPCGWRARHASGDGKVATATTERPLVGVIHSRHAMTSTDSRAWPAADAPIAPRTHGSPAWHPCRGTVATTSRSLPLCVSCVGRRHRVSGSERLGRAGPLVTPRGCDNNATWRT